MIVITKNKKIKQYQIPDMPNFKHNISKISWLERQKKEAELINIRSVSVQIKDINQMIYSEDLHLLSLYARYTRQQLKNNLPNESFITFDKYRKNNKPILWALLNADWILKAEDLENKSTDELENDILNLENEIQTLTQRVTTSHNKGAVNNRIKLLKYKLSCINDYLSKKTIDSPLINDKVRKLSNH